jgi:hypothetical protein
MTGGAVTVGTVGTAADTGDNRATLSAHLDTLSALAQIRLTSFRFASVSPPIYRCVALRRGEAGMAAAVLNRSMDAVNTMRLKLRLKRPRIRARGSGRYVRQ